MFASLVADPHRKRGITSLLVHTMCVLLLAQVPKQMLSQRQTVVGFQPVALFLTYGRAQTPVPSLAWTGYAHVVIGNWFFVGLPRAQTPLLIIFALSIVDPDRPQGNRTSITGP